MSGTLGKWASESFSLGYGTSATLASDATNLAQTGSGSGFGRLGLQLFLLRRRQRIDAAVRVRDLLPPTPPGA